MTSVSPDGSVPSVAILIDDLVAWHGFAGQPTGIQRAASEVLDTALRRTDVRAWPAASIVGLRSDQPRLLEIERGSLRWASPEGQTPRQLTILRSARGVVSRAPLPSLTRTWMKRLYGRLTVYTLGGRDAQSADLLLVPGAFWIGEMATRIPQLVRQGIPVRALVYDLFPPTRPESFEPALRDDFEHAMDAVIPICDRIVTLGESPARELVARYPSVSDRVRAAVPDLHAHSPKTSGAGDHGAIEVRPIPSPYILALSTVEPRKNHRLILDAWRLYRSRKPIGTLVIVGRRGWETGEIEDEIGRDAASFQIVRIESVTDTELEALYAGAAATVHASWAEGFGLPVRESVARGITTLVSTGIPRDGLPEDQVELFAPHDSNRLSYLIEEALTFRGPRRPVVTGAGTGWEPMVSALLD